MSPQLGSRDPAEEAEAWAARAEELADWAEDVLVNRRDVYGGQQVVPGGTFPRTTRHDTLTWGRLVRHFAAETSVDVIGLHATAPDETCRWAAVDIDNHDGSEVIAEGNLRFAREVRNRAHRAGLAVRLIDSSGGRGGFHVWIAFERPIPMADARRLSLWLIRDWAEHGLSRPPELSPGNDHLTGKRCGNWLRLPGRHHKRPPWAKVWSPRRQAWLSGDEAIDALLTLRGRPVDVAAIVPPEFGARPTKGPGPPRRGRPRVALVASPGPKRHGRAGCGPREARLAGVALEHYRNDDLDYDAWLEVGMALKNLEDDDAGFELRDRWSGSSAKYDADATAAKWASFRPADRSGDVGLGTLFMGAKQAGWEGPAFDVSVDDLGIRRATHRSGRRGTISIPARIVESAPTGPAHGQGTALREDEAEHGGSPIR